MQSKNTFWSRNKDSILTWTIVILVILLVTGYCDRRASENESSNLQDALNDTISYYTNKQGQQVARISVLEARDAQTLLNIKSKDSSIIRLQNLVEHYKKQLNRPGSSATIFDSESNYGESTATGGSVIPGSSTDDNKDYVALPYMYSNRDTTWLSFNFTISKDSTTYCIKTKDKYSVVIGEESQGWFKKAKPFVDVTNENPNSFVKTLRTFKVSNSPKNFHIGPGLFYGVGTEFKPQVFIGAGVMWTPLNF